MPGFSPTPALGRRATIKPQARTSPAEVQTLAEVTPPRWANCATFPLCLEVLRTVGPYKPRDPALTGIDGHVFAAAINAGGEGLLPSSFRSVLGRRLADVWETVVALCDSLRMTLAANQADAATRPPLPAGRWPTMGMFRSKSPSSRRSSA